jgi:hypothetical protein
VIEVTKRVLSVVVLALALAGTAAASSPLRGVVVGTGNGVVFVAAPGGKLTMIRGHAKLGTRVVFNHGRLVAVARPHAAKAVVVNAVRRNDDDDRDARIEIEGVVAAVGTGTVTLSVGGQLLTVQLPAGVSVPASFVGRAVELELEFAAPGMPPHDDHGGVVTTPGHDGGDDHGGGHGGSGRH